MTETDIAMIDSDITDDEARKAFNNLLADRRLRIGDRGKSILSYLGEHYFSNQPASVKGYSIAIDVLGRPPSFDPTTDPIVRIELSRLRSALTQYYEAYGQDGMIEVSLPKGKYVLSFARLTGTDNIPPPSSLIKKPKLLTALAPLSIIVLGFVLFSLDTERPLSSSGKPSVALSFGSDDQILDEETGRMKDSITNALGNFGTLLLHDKNEISDQTNSQFGLRMKYRAHQDTRSIWWQVTNPAQNQILDSGVDHIRLAGHGPQEAEAQLAAVFSQKMAAVNGIINTRLVRENQGQLTGNTCILKTEIDLSQGFSADEGYQCLERVLATTPNDSDALAAMARILAINPNGPYFDPQRSLNYAQRAETLAPQSDRVQLALSQAFLMNGRADMAVIAGQRGLTFNPNNQELLAALALAYFANGDFDQATHLLQPFDTSTIAPTLTGRLVMLLDFVRRHDWDNAERVAKQVPAQSGRVLSSDLAALNAGMLPATRAAFETEAKFDVSRFRTLANQLSASNGSITAGDLIILDINTLRSTKNTLPVSPPTTDRLSNLP